MRGKENTPFIKRKTSLLISILLVFLCLTNIVGMTAALFFDDNEDGKICVNITTGQVKVDIVDIHQQSLEGDVLRFARSHDQGMLYFEPGAAYCTQGFQIKNEGNILINYNLYISNDPNMDMVAFKKAFDVYITDDLEGFRTVEPLTSFQGTLQPKTNSTTYYLIVRMKADADNVFQQQRYDGIGVTVYAVQGNVGVEE